MIDIFEPHAPFEREKYPPRTDEHKAELQAFFGGVARPDVATEKLVKFGQVLRSEGAKKVGAYGMCWGKLSFEMFLAWRRKR
jgi:dienelactone hydrolase